MSAARPILTRLLCSASLWPAASRLVLVACLALPVTSGMTIAQDQPAAETVSVSALSDALQLPALFAVLRDEGLSYGAGLETDMFAGRGGAQWQAALDGIYNPDLLRTGFEATLTRELSGDAETVTAILDFFSSDLGQRVVGLEIEARRAFLDTGREEAARVAVDTRRAARDPKIELVGRFIEAGDLVEMNVAGSLSGNLAFLTGMSDSGAYGAPLPRDEMIAQTWGQEAQIRDNTTSWLFAYLGLAYDPLSEAELQAYIDFMESPAGKRLNAALFVAFDQVFRQVSYDLGHAAGQAMQGRDI